MHDVLWPTMCSGDGPQPNLRSQLDMPILKLLRQSGAYLFLSEERSSSWEGWYQIVL